MSSLVVRATESKELPILKQEKTVTQHTICEKQLWFQNKFAILNEGYFGAQTLTRGRLIPVTPESGKMATALPLPFQKGGIGGRSFFS